MIHVTEKAAKKILEVMSENSIPNSGGIRIGVKGGGCSGFLYEMSLEIKKGDNDKVFLKNKEGKPLQKRSKNGFVIFVDLRVVSHVFDVTIDYSDDLMTSGFVFNNPNATSTCGCGESFS
jgi:iron-sulfur cluster assembly protein